MQRQAEHNFSSGNFQAAAEEYERLLKMVGASGDEDYIIALEQRLGDCYEKLNHQSHEERVSDHKKACEHYLKAADRLQDRGEWEKAGQIFEKSAKALEEFDANKEAGHLYKKSATMAPVFRSGLARDVHLPRPLLQELGVREGEDLLVRPVA